MIKDPQHKPARSTVPAYLSIPQHTHYAPVIENCWSFHQALLTLLSLPRMAFPTPFAWPVSTDESIYSIDGYLLSIYCVPIIVISSGDTMMN